MKMITIERLMKRLMKSLLTWNASLKACRHSEVGVRSAPEDGLAPKDKL